MKEVTDNMSDNVQDSKQNSKYEEYMKMAIDIAKTAIGHTSPNPLVGCVVVKDGRVISKACHERYGEYHAERNALLRCEEDTAGAELYVTLEPCCHYGKTPPCTEIIIEKGIKKVYIGSMDSNPLVSGKGVEILRENGVEVECGICKEECDKMNEIFFHFIENKTPFVAAKYAMTIDGKIAAYTGDSKWVTGEESRMYVQNLRKRYSGIMVGINTILEDDPMLNCRIEEGVNPVRIILDSDLRIPMESKIVQTAGEIKTIVACCENKVKDEADKADKAEKAEALEKMGVEVLKIKGNSQDNSRVNLKELMKLLGERKIDSILLEGGGTVNASAFEAGIVSKVYAFIAPKIIMGKESMSPVSGKGIKFMQDAIELENIEIVRIQDDILIKGYPKKSKSI